LTALDDIAEVIREAGHRSASNFKVAGHATHQRLAQLESVARELHRVVEEWIEPYGSLQPETLELLDQLRPSRRSA
jgi:hypothetical protein